MQTELSHAIVFRKHGLHDLIDQVGANRYFHAGLGHEIHDVFRAPIQFGVAALAAEALDLGDGHA
jgi:hypothetical protein